MGLPKYDLGKFKATNKSGIQIEYSIENITEDAKMDEGIEHMIKYFLPREPMTRHLGAFKKEGFLKMIRELFTKAFKGGNTIGAYLVENDSKGRLIGVNVTTVVNKDHEQPKDEKDPDSKVILGLVKHSIKNADVFGHYGVDKFLEAYGLSVHPDFHGFQVGYRILESREKLCQLLGLKVTATFFSAAAAQHLASKLNYEVLYEIDYEDVEVDGKKPFAGLFQQYNEKKCMIAAKQFS